jgi:phosphoribosylformimino-5-aminoimidazole carboxamide ribotide isomerase
MIEIIPAMDIIGGRCVRLTHGDFERKTEYAGDPIDAAKRFEAAGLRRLHIVDLDGARSGHPHNLSVLENVAAVTAMKIDFGGGLRTRTDIDSVFDAGASIANVGTVAAKRPDEFFRWSEHYGPENLLVGADARNGNIAVNGWQTQTALGVVEFLKNLASRGISEVFATDIALDGAMAGPSVDLYSEIRNACPDLRLIASGGVRSISDIDELERIGCSGVIIGKALYEGNLDLDQLRKYVG